jgi:hypothetical protein
VATGVAFSASIIQAPVREGVRRFIPAASSGERTSRSRVWKAWPPWVCSHITSMPSKSSATSSNMS